jgi:hypothetical protein
MASCFIAERGGNHHEREKPVGEFPSNESGNYSDHEI